MGLRALLGESGIDLARDQVKIVPVPGSQGAGVNFGVTAAKALEDGRIDGFWANGMGTEVAVRRGVGSVVLDVRRGDGPPGCFDYTLSALATSDKLIAQSPQVAAAAIRALRATQVALTQNPDLATEVGRKRFPAAEAELIAELIRRDGPYYSAEISRQAVSGMSRFARTMGILDRDLGYEEVVATQFIPLWNTGT
jgi:ABC-type nitrate/sulfonate/bicarbonate transport system substrate-binding protein